MKDFARPSCRTILLAAAAFAVLPAQANDITTEWASVKPPPVPQLKAATVDPKTTALLILDLNTRINLLKLQNTEQEVGVPAGGLSSCFDASL